MLSPLGTREGTRIYHINKQQSRVISLVVQAKFGKTSKSFKILWKLLSSKFSFVSYVYISGFN